MLKTLIFIVNILKKVVPFDSCAYFQEASHGIKAPWNTTLGSWLSISRPWGLGNPEHRLQRACSEHSSVSFFVFHARPGEAIPSDMFAGGLSLFLMCQPYGFWFSHEVSLFLIRFLKQGEEPWEIEP